MTSHKEALTLALEALESSRIFVTSREKIKHPEGTDWYDERIAAIKEALAQPEQEPTNLERHERNVQKFLGTQQPKEPEQDEYLSKAYRLANELRCHLAIAPAPQRTWVGLTDEEKYELADDVARRGIPVFEAIRQAEAKLKEKNI